MRNVPEPSTFCGPRTAVLLGAGASRDAGLPLTESLAQRLVKSFDEDLAASDQYRRREQWPVVRALHIVYGAMVAHATEQGSSPLSAVNVERLVSAVRLLRDRRTHESAPFVAAWRGSVEEVDDHPLPLTDRDLKEHVGFERDLSFKISGLVNDIATIAKAVVSPGDGSIFRTLEDQLLRRICTLLEKPDNVDYLLPLVELARTQSGGLDITTLNYDRTVELAASIGSIPIDAGLSRWAPGQPLVFTPTDGQINLIKPHGSIDWVRISGTAQNRLDGHPLVRHVYRADEKPSPVAHWGTADTPLIVIGDREKLETDGPTLPLMRAFEESLHRASNLVVVGYSFGDEHVNTVVRNWLAADGSRTIVILDPKWRSSDRFVIGPDTNLSMRDALGFLASTSLSAAAGRVVVVRKGAKEGLSEALTATPLEKVTELLTVETHFDEPQYLEITNNGYALETLEISASRMANNARYQSIGSLRFDVAAPGNDSVVVSALAHGESVRVFFDPIPEGQGTGRIHLSGNSWAHTVYEHREIALPKIGAADPTGEQASADDAQ